MLNNNTVGSSFIQKAIAKASSPSVFGNEVVGMTTPANGIASISKNTDSKGRSFFICGESLVDGECIVE